ncbi:hypothetical protein bsdtb5_29160 [Anaeromicropila herbilytica]|uniref:Uncharacterized protein n=1 Tax=Anaeromicropila herbilytica TaxID=2785025 RepID=A0A7R7EN12_9FIRM|nr:hypothetical protein bsdtb5_29160 [Anaeromicropila herbilytica]
MFDIDMKRSYNSHIKYNLSDCENVSIVNNYKFTRKLKKEIRILELYEIK